MMWLHGMRWGRALPLLLVGSLMAAGPLVAQEDLDSDDPATAQLDSLELVFEREVFNYPLFERRNPFRPLGADEASGPRFEDLVYLGAILSSTAGESIALVGARFPGATSGQAAARTYRLRLNEVLGNIRVLDIRTDAVLVEVQDFGVTETRTLSRRAEPPPPPAVEPAEPEPADETPPQGPTQQPVPDGDSISGGQARIDDVNGRRPTGGSFAANAENGNGGWT